MRVLAAPFSRHFSCRASHFLPAAADQPLDEDGHPLPTKTFTMIVDGKEVRRQRLCGRSRDLLQVEVVHTQFRVSEDHKLRAMLKKQSAKVMVCLFCFIFCCV